MKTCLITGVTHGLGRHLCEYFKAQGYHIVGIARDQKALAVLHKANILDDYYVCDLAKTNSISDFINNFENKYQSLELLIHNAAIQSSYDIVDDTHYYGLLQTEMFVNFLAPARITSHLLPLLMQGNSQVVVISSLLQLGPKKAAPGYCASKAALANWISNLREQLKHTSISVTEVIPGLIKTSLTKKAAEEGVEPSILARDIGENLNKDQVVLQGAKLGWYVSQFAPSFVKHKLLISES